MKYNKLVFHTFLLSLLIYFTSFGQSDHNITIKFQNDIGSEEIYLAHYFGYNQYIRVDTARNVSGLFQFSNDKKLKGGIYLIVLNDSTYYDIIYSGQEKTISITADISDFVGTAEFKGSLENVILYSYRNFLKRKSIEASEINSSIINSKDNSEKEIYYKKMQSLQESVKHYIGEFIEKNEGTFASKIIKANQEIEIPKLTTTNPDGTPDSTFAFRYYKSHFWENIDFSDDRILRTPFYLQKLEKYFNDLVFKTQDSIIVDCDRILKLAKNNSDVYRYTLWWTTNRYENIDIVGLDGVFIHLAENYYLKDADWIDSTQYAKFEERVRILKPLKTGAIFPELIVADLTGREIEIKDNSSKYTIVYFYDPDCGHCKESAPELVKFYEENKAYVAIYNIAVEYDYPKIKKFVETYNTSDLINCWDSKSRYYFREKFDIYSTPTSYILNDQKKIIGKRIPILEFGRFLEFYEKTN